MINLHDYHFPLIAILRGLAPAEAPQVGQVLFEAGFRLLEVPLNRPGALDAIRELIRIAPPDAIIGGGTVLTIADVDAIRAVGGKMTVSPNCEPEIVRHAVENDMLALPGVLTPTEAFSAMRAGAQGVKLFPAEMTPPEVVKSLRSVIPCETWLLPVGGIRPHSIAAYVEAGASGFGIGSALYKPGVDLATLKLSAHAYMLAREAVL
ncbi:MAG: 2-dehydro-3-deoxy-6-phosphogalactonate aldolase [Pseudomonadota bacterium]